MQMILDPARYGFITLPAMTVSCFCRHLGCLLLGEHASFFFAVWRSLLLPRSPATVQCPASICPVAAEEGAVVAAEDIILPAVVAITATGRTGAAGPETVVGPAAAVAGLAATITGAAVEAAVVEVVGSALRRVTPSRSSSWLPPTEAKEPTPLPVPPGKAAGTVLDRYFTPSTH
jgi:hypothetical protein